MKDPIWKRSAFGVFLLALIAMAARALLDSQVPTSTEVIEAGATLLVAFGYTVTRPTTRA